MRDRRSPCENESKACSAQSSWISDGHGNFFGGSFEPVVDWPCCETLGRVAPAFLDLNLNLWSPSTNL